MSDEIDRALAESVRRAYRAAPPDSGAARERLKQSLRDEPPPRRAWAGEWWLQREVFAWRPALLAACAAGLLVAGVGLDRMILSRSPHARGEAAAPTQSQRASRASDDGIIRVTFALSAPGASRVAIAGDFNGWDPEATPLRRAAIGNLWTADVPLPQGLHVYAFVVDGERWMADPSAPRAPQSNFGTRNSVVVVGSSGAL